MSEYLLLLRDEEQRWERFSPEEYESVIQKFMSWNAALKEREQFVGAGKLSGDRGRTVRLRGGKAVVDGPFAEAKEAIAGYFRVRGESLEHAAEIAAGCPILGYGGSVEVRELASPAAPRPCRSE